MVGGESYDQGEGNPMSYLGYVQHLEVNKITNGWVCVVYASNKKGVRGGHERKMYFSAFDELSEWLKRVNAEGWNNET